MSSPIDEDKDLERNRRTLMLLVGGAVSLVIPLLGVAYMHWKDVRAQAPAAAPSLGVFEHHADGSAGPISPALTPAPDGPAGNRLAQVPQMAPRDNSPAPLQPGAAGQTAGSSLSMVRGSDDYYQQQQAAAPAAPAQQQAAPPPQQAPAPAADAQAGAKVASVGSLKGRQPVKPAYKPFNAPHLSGSRFGGGSGGQGMGGMGAPGGMQGGANNPAAAMAAMQQMGGGQGGAGMPNMGAMMQQMQGAQGGQGGAGMPNMGAMMQQMQGAQGGQGGGAGMPNMGAMMQQMQGAQGGQGGQGMPNMGGMMQQMGQQQH